MLLVSHVTCQRQHTKSFVETLFAVNDIFDFFLYAGTLFYACFSFTLLSLYPFTLSFSRKRESMGFRLPEL